MSTHRLKLFLVCTILAAVGSGGLQAAGWPDWAGSIEEESYLERFGDEDAVIVLDEWSIKLKGGKRSGKRRWMIHVLTEDGREYARLALSSGAFSRYGKVTLWIRQPNGRVFKFSKDEGSLYSASSQRILDDTHFLVLAPPGVRPGSMVAVEARFESDADLPQDMFWIQRGIPVWRTAISVDTRAGWSVQANIFTADRKEAERDPERTSWEFTAVAASHIADQYFAQIPPRTMMTLNYVPPQGEIPFRDWNGTALWVHDLFDSREEDRPLFREALAEIASSDDIVDSAGRLARRIRYFGVELGWGGFRPHPSETTLRRALGDCKDKALLMVSLLQENGIAAAPILVMSPSHGYVPSELPSPFHFNHAVVGIPWGDEPRTAGMAVVDDTELGPLRIYDPTMSDRSGQDIPPHLEGGAGLIVHPDSTRLIRLPGSEAADNVLEAKHRWFIDSSDGLEGSMTVRCRGAMRSIMQSEEEEWKGPKELIEDNYSDLFHLMAGIDEVESSEIREELDGAWAYDIDYSGSQVLGGTGGVRSLNFTQFIGHTLIPLPEAEEEEDVYHLPLMGTFRESYSIEYPGREMIGHPENLDFSNSLGSVSLSIQPGLNEAHIERELVLGTLEFPHEKWGEADALRAALRQINRVWLLLSSHTSE